MKTSLKKLYIADGLEIRISPTGIGEFAAEIDLYKDGKVIPSKGILSSNDDLLKSAAQAIDEKNPDRIIQLLRGNGGLTLVQMATCIENAIARQPAKTLKRFRDMYISLLQGTLAFGGSQSSVLGLAGIDHLVVLNITMQCITSEPDFQAMSNTKRKARWKKCR